MRHRSNPRPPTPVKPWTGPKPTLNMQIISTCRVHYKDLEVYLCKVFRMKHCDVLSITGSRGAMTPEIVVDGVIRDIGNLGQQLVDIRGGRQIRNLSLALNLLCKDGFIPKGLYIVDTTPLEKPIELYRRALNRVHTSFDAECLRIKNKNRKDARFMRQATLLDTKLIALQKEQEANESTPN